MNELLAFDFDGTLFDTDEANQRAYNEALIEFGYSMSLKFYKEHCKGKNYKEFLPKILKTENPEMLKAIHEAKKKYYSKHYGCVKINESLITFIRIKRVTCKIALVTTASRASVMDILSLFSVGSYFDYIIAGEDVTNHKPDPECYIMAMEMANASPDTTTIYEDSKEGIRAAVSSGAQVVICDLFA